MSTVFSRLPSSQKICRRMPRAKGARSSFCVHEEILHPRHEMHQGGANRGGKYVETRCHAPPYGKYTDTTTRFAIPCLTARKYARACMVQLFYCANIQLITVFALPTVYLVTRLDPSATSLYATKYLIKSDTSSQVTDCRECGYLNINEQRYFPCFLDVAVYAKPDLRKDAFTEKPEKLRASPAETYRWVPNSLQYVHLR